MEQIIENEVSVRNIFTEKALHFGTFLGGPLTSGYLFAKNFKSLGEPEKAKKALIYGLMGTILLFTIVFLIPAEIISKIPSVIIPILYTSIANYIFQRSQRTKTAEYINNGGKAFSLWRVFGISLVGAAITIIPFFGIRYLSDKANAANEISTIHGNLQHQLNYNKNNISAPEVQQIAEGLKRIAFFDEESTKYTYVKKVDNAYEIMISCNEDIKQTSYSFTPLVSWRNELQDLFPKNKIIFVLVVDDLDNVIKRLE